MPTPRALRPAFAALLLFGFSGFAQAATQVLPGQWSDALTVAALPDGSLLVAEASGEVDRLSVEGGVFAEPRYWADLAGEGDTLLGLAVDPNFLASGYVYAAVRTLEDGKPVVRISRWRSAGDQVILNRVLVDGLPSGFERAGGVLKVGPDGSLWLGIGDGGAPAAEVKPGNLRGVLLHYNDDGSLPASNPTPGSPVWAWGLRDPGALAWQPGTGRLYSLDRGPPIPKGTNDRLDIVEKGGDYGWPKYTARDSAKGIIKAVTFCSSGHSWVPNGAVFATQGEWAGSLLYAGSGQGVLYRMTLDTKNPSKILFYEEMINGALGALMDVTLGADDQPYLLSREHLYRLIP